MFTEGNRQLDKCDICKKWFSIARLCTNDINMKKYCIECYKKQLGLLCASCGLIAVVGLSVRFEGEDWIDVCAHCYEEMREKP